MSEMTDRELLEMAAKAAGLNVRFNPSFCGGMGAWERDVRPVEPPLSEWLPWNPLTDDGDAFRLSVRLKLSVLHDESLDGVPVVMVDENPYDDNLDEYVCAPCSLGATRRAIVRAAAEIGKQMP